MAEECGEQEDTRDILPLLLGPGEPSDRATRPGGVDLHTILVIARHLSQGGAIALLEPFLVTRPGQRGGTIEFRLAAMVHRI